MLLIDWDLKINQWSKTGYYSAEKDHHFCRFSEKMLTLISEKSLNNSWNIGPIGIKIGKNDPPNSSKKIITGNFDISFICDFCGQKPSNFPQNGQNLVLSRKKLKYQNFP